MNKPDAADRLGLSVRQLERMVTARRIRSYKKKTDKGQEADFHDEDVEKLRQELAAERGEDLSEEGEVVSSPEIATDAPATSRHDENQSQIGNSMALATLRRGESAIVPTTTRQDSLPDVAKVFAASLQVVLTIDDICLQTPFSHDFVRKAFQQGELKGKKIGRGWCANREDFDAWRRGLMG